MAYAYRDKIYPLNSEEIVVDKQFVEKRVAKKMRELQKQNEYLGDRGAMEVKASEMLKEFYEHCIDVFKRHLTNATDDLEKYRACTLIARATYALEVAESYHTVVYA